MSKSITEIRSLARSYSKLAIETLAGVAKNGKSESARVAASLGLLDRGWGKAEQRVEAEHVVRYVADVPSVSENIEQWQQQHAPTIQ